MSSKATFSALTFITLAFSRLIAQITPPHDPVTVGKATQEATLEKASLRQSPQAEPVLSAHVPPLSPHVLAVPSDPSLTVQYVMRGEEETFTASVATGAPQDLATRPLDLRGYKGALKAFETYGRLRTTSGRRGPSLHLASYFREDGAVWGELSIGSEAIEACIAGLDGHLVIEMGDKVVWDGDVQCPDLTGLAFRIGSPFPCVLDDVLSSLEARLPDFVVPPAALNVWCSRVDPDPYWNTHQTGSPRNSYWSIDLLYWIGSKSPQVIEHLEDFVLSQYGFVGDDGKYRAGRPYHLAMDDGTPWQQRHHYKIDSDASRPAEMFEGRPLIFSRGADTLGRRAFYPKGLPDVRRNGYDHEHMEVERLFAAAILLRSERARRDLVHLAEALWSQKWGIYHSSRTLGWNLRLYVRAYQVLRRPIDKSRIEEILDRAWELRDWEGRSVFPSFCTRNRAAGGPPGGTHEATWQAATVGAAAFEARQFFLEEDPDLARKAERLVIHAAEIARIGWHPSEGGMADSYDVFLETSPGSGRPAKYWSPQKLGVAMWTIAPLAHAFEITGEERYAVIGRDLTRHGAQTRVSGHTVNGVRSWSFAYFVEANRVFGMPVH